MSVSVAHLGRLKVKWTKITNKPQPTMYSVETIFGECLVWEEYNQDHKEGYFVRLYLNFDGTNAHKDIGLFKTLKEAKKKAELEIGKESLKWVNKFFKRDIL